MKKYLAFIFYSFIFTFSQTLIGQDSANNCGFDELHKKKIQKDNRYNKRTKQINNIVYDIMRSSNSSQESNTVYTIPVVIHIMHLGEPVGTGSNISDIQILAGIDHLNDAFRNIGNYAGGPFYSNAGINSSDVEIEFCLAVRDPTGSPSTGITRVNTPYSNLSPSSLCNPIVGSSSQDDCMKALSYWNSTKYMNVYLVNDISGAAGYAYLSSSHGELYDGIVMESKWWGTSTDNSKVAIHEAGHYLNLYHTFQGNCNETDCLLGGDRICDTPPDNSLANVDCSSGDTTNTCNNDATIINSPFTNDVQDMYENYMDYGNLVCLNTFTPNQVTRMRMALTTDRVSLLSSDGCTPSTTIVTNFTTDSTNCIDGTVSFQDRSAYNFTSWNWTFPGGTPSSSTDKNPTVVYHSAGSYDVTLETSNNQNTGSITKTDFITIYSNPNPNCTINIAPNYNYASFKLGIKYLMLENINHTTDGTIAQELTYSDFSCTDIAYLQPDMTYAFSTQVGPLNFENVRAYIDYNNDGDFIDAGEEIISVDSVKGVVPIQFFTTSVSPVQDTILRMRLISDLFPTTIHPCSTAFFGHIEDYGIYFSSHDTPDSYFIADTTSGCDGLIVTFQDISTNQPTSWNWSFPGGTPSSSTEEHPTIIYNSTGFHDVTLVSSNSSGVGTTEIKSNFIEIIDNDNDGISDCNDNCPNISNANQENIDGDNFGEPCDCDDNNPNDENIIINNNPIGTTTILSNSSITSLGFIAINDTVIFQAKDSIILKAEGGIGFMASEGSDFIAKIDTCEMEITPLVKNTNDEVKTIFLENLVKEKSNISNNIDFQISPNPFQESANIVITLQNATNIDLTIYDAFGNKLVNIVSQQYLEAGTYSFVFNEKRWSKGLYLAVLQSDNKTIVKKMIKIE